MTETTTKSEWRSRTERAWSAWGLDCLALALEAGHRCGYVRVPEGHPWFGLDYDDGVDGRTRSQRGKWGEPLDDDIPYESQIQAVLDAHGGITFAGERPGEDAARGWWFGFDCAHAWDAKDPELIATDIGREVYEQFPPGPDEVVRSLDYVVAECERLAAQLQAAATTYSTPKKEPPMTETTKRGGPDSDKQEVRRLLERISEQQNVETAYAMEEASEDEMFTATAAVYRAAGRLRAFSDNGGDDE